MSLGCARCGSCCDPVHLSTDVRDRIDAWRERAEDVWAGVAPLPEGDVAFILAHWHEIEHKPTGTTYRCDRFDPERRECTAHDDRPEVCSGFPFYGAPIATGAALGIPTDDAPACSYWLDVAPDLRPAGVRPLIPVEVVSPRP